MNRETLPDEDEQFEAYADLVRGMDGKPVTIRTLDIGGDKTGRAARQDDALGSAQPGTGSARDPPVAARARLLDAQLGRHAARLGVGPVRILLADDHRRVDELKSVRDALAQVVRRLKRRGVRLPRQMPPLGVMIEIPGAALGGGRAWRRGRFLRHRHQ